jgi:hypothetical protein
MQSVTTIKNQIPLSTQPIKSPNQPHSNPLIYGGCMDAGAVVGSESTFTLYLTLFTLKREKFYA